MSPARPLLTASASDFPSPLHLEGSILARVARRLIEAGAALAAAVALAGCAGAAGSGGGAVPYPRGSWSADDQSAFTAACDAVAGATYCACALGDEMQQYPDASSLPGPVASRGTRAGRKQQQFPDCSQL
jgi:hypothetical protein